MGIFALARIYFRSEISLDWLAFFLMLHLLFVFVP